MEYPQRVRLDSVVAKARQKAMHTDLILDLIATRMDLEDLWTLRRTCTLWNRTFVPPLRDKEKVIVLACCVDEDPRPQWQQLLENDNEIIDQADASANARTRPRSIRDFIALIRDSTEVPWGKYALIDAHTNAARLEEVDEFFRLCGGSISGLDLRLGISRTFRSTQVATQAIKTKVVDIQALRRIIFQQTPNLKELRIIASTFGPAQAAGGARVTAADKTLVPVRDLPRLLKFSFSVTPHWVQDEHDMAPLENNASNLDTESKTLLADLLRHTTNLKGLDVYNEPHASNFELITTLRDKIPAERLAKLKTIKIGSLGVSDLEILLDLAGRDRARRQHPLRLETFLVSIDGPTPFDFEEFEGFEDYVKPLYRFLESQSATLRHFGVVLPTTHFNVTNSLDTDENEEADGDRHPNHRIAIPLMPAVRTFLLKCDGYWNNLPPPGTPPLEINFPGLVRYEYVNTFQRQDPGVLDIMEGLGHRGSSLTNLSLDTHIVGAVEGDPNGFRTVYGDRFQLSLITRLEIEIMAFHLDIFRQVCAHMPSLEVLQFTCTLVPYNRAEGARAAQLLNLDELLTGIPKDRFGNLERALGLHAPTGSHSVGMFRMLLHEYKTEPGLQDLRNLKKLVINVFFPHGPGQGCRLTNIGGYAGLVVATPSLQHISIGTVTEGQRRRMSRNVGNLVSAKCEAVIRSVMSPPAVVCFY